MGRLFYLDNLRSFALFLGIVFHAAIVYAPKIGYAIQDSNRSDIFSFFCYYIHSFRMPLFFLISGYFSALVWEKKGKRSYFDGRFHRIFIPMCLGLLFLAPIQYYLVTKLKNPHLTFFHFYPSFFSESTFAHSHIWFLVDLFLFSLIFITIPKSFLKRIAIGFPKNEIVFLSVCAIFIFSLTLFAHSFFPRGDDFFGIDKLTFAYQFGFFLIGTISFYSNSIFRLEKTISILSFFTWLLTGISIFILFYQIEISDPLWMPYFSFGIEKRAYHIFLWCISPLVWTKVLVMFFQKYVNFTNPFTMYLVESSLPIYLLHHPISLSVAFYFRTLTFPLYVKFSIHTLIVFSLSFILYDVLIKNSTLLRKIFGLK
jgi:glucan biosynthesis protein C